MKLIQVLAQLWDIDGLEADEEMIDPINGDLGVAFMPCGHCFSRARMKELIEWQLEQGKMVISCPTEEEG